MPHNDGVVALPRLITRSFGHPFVRHTARDMTG